MSQTAQLAGTCCSSPRALFLFQIMRCLSLSLFLTLSLFTPLFIFRLAQPICQKRSMDRMSKDCWDVTMAFLDANDQFQHALSSKTFCNFYFWYSPDASNKQQRLLVPLKPKNLKIVMLMRRAFYFNLQDALHGAVIGTAAPGFTDAPGPQMGWKEYSKKLLRVRVKRRRLISAASHPLVRVRAPIRT